MIYDNFCGIVGLLHVWLGGVSRSRRRDLHGAAAIAKGERSSKGEADLTFDGDAARRPDGE